MTESIGYSIGALADEFDLTLRTLRFYEAQGFLRPAKTGKAGWTRRYSEQDRRNLIVVLEAKRLGYALAEIAKLRDGDQLVLPAETIRQQIERLTAQAAGIDAAITRLHGIEGATHGQA